MHYKRLLTIQDISCVGQCSITVALPIVSALGIETCILPSAVLSTHTGFPGYTFDDLTESMPQILKHWLDENISFDAFYTGYLGNAKQIDYVKEIMAKTARGNAVKIVDPAMADNGVLYPGFDNNFVDKMKELCQVADYLLPNVTEASYLADVPYKEEFDEAYIELLLDKLHNMGAKNIIMTGVSFNSGRTGVMIYSDNKSNYYEHEKLNCKGPGTGDVYSAAFTGALLNEKNVYESARIAADYAVECIKNTCDDKEHWYGVKFETAIDKLINMVK